MDIPKTLPTGYSQVVVFTLIAYRERSAQEIADVLDAEYSYAHVILHRLRKKGLITTKKVNIAKQGRHFVFCLTEDGIKARSFMKGDWS
jgi:predicted transcriptional regulator